MNKDEIIEMWKSAGDIDIVGMPYSKVEQFAKLVAAKERKEICGTVQQIVPITNWAHELLDAIRARCEA